MILIDALIAPINIMSPRKYRLGKRASAVEETRQRIVESVVQLHGEKGVLATTYEDIARLADVSPATVYRHFPSVADMIPACGARISEITSPPDPSIFTDAETPEDRVLILVEALFGFWHRVEPWLGKARMDAPKVPTLARFIREDENAIRALVADALGEDPISENARVAVALTDFYAWRALSDAGLEEEAARIVTEMLLNRISR
jgi:AcrR family transcriptional regulator